MASSECLSSTHNIRSNPPFDGSRQSIHTLLPSIGQRIPRAGRRHMHFNMSNLKDTLFKITASGLGMATLASAAWFVGLGGAIVGKQNEAKKKEVKN